MSSRTTFARTLVCGALLGAAFISGPLSQPLSAQESLAMPALSPQASVSRTIGLTAVAVDYHAPSVRGREIFGAMIPFDVVWRAGANGTTKVSFSDDVTVDGQPLAAGDYGLHMIPGAERWTVIFNNVSEGWGSYAYDPALDALRVEVHPKTVAHGESMAFRFYDVGAEEATLALHWGETLVPMTIGVDVVSAVLKPVREAALADDDSPGAEFWFQAGDYGRDHGVDIAETMDWADRSIAVQRGFDNLWLRSELLGDKGDTAGAGEAREAALQLADLNSLQGLGYRYMLREDMKNAAVVFEMVLSMEPTNWWPYVQMGKVKRSLGDDAGAIAALRAALDKNPDPVTRAEIEANLSDLGAG